MSEFKQLLDQSHSLQLESLDALHHQWVPLEFEFTLLQKRFNDALSIIQVSIH
jgi:hypothetical protein